VSASQRRAAAQRGLRAGVPHSPRKQHQDDDALPADSTANTRGGDVGARRRTASGGSGARPASPFGCYEARECAQSAPGCFSPSHAAPRDVHDGGEAAAGRSNGGARLGLGRRRRQLRARVFGEKERCSKGAAP
jgi:hypothetical protein